VNTRTAQVFGWAGTKVLRCPYCGRDVTPRKGRVPSHVTAGGLRCIAIGWDVRQAATLRDNIDRRAK
jgi:hypothetical protein